MSEETPKRRTRRRKSAEAAEESETATETDHSKESSLFEDWDFEEVTDDGTGGE